MPGCIKPFIFCLFLFEADRRELWITVQMRGSDYTCAVSDAWTWASTYPEVKTGLTPNHPLITKSPHQRISCREIRGLTSSWPLTMMRGHRECRPKSRMNYKEHSYPRHQTCNPTQHHPDNFMWGDLTLQKAEQPTQKAFYTIPAQMTEHPGEKKWVPCELPRSQWIYSWKPPISQNSIYFKWTFPGIPSVLQKITSDLSVFRCHWCIFVFS